MAQNDLKNLRDLTVGDLCERGFCIDVIDVLENTPFEAIVEAIRGGPPFHSVVVLNEERKVVGRVSVEHLYEAVILDIFPEQALSAATDLESVMEVAEELQHNRARDIMEEPNVASVSDSAPDVLGKILRENLKGIVVVDAAEKLVGYLDRMTIISNWPELTAAS